MAEKTSRKNRQCKQPLRATYSKISDMLCTCCDTPLWEVTTTIGTMLSCKVCTPTHFSKPSKNND